MKKSVALRAVMMGIGILAAAPIWAMSLTQALSLARTSDPAFLTAQAGVLAARGRFEQAYGAMLPQISASISSNGNQRGYATRGNEIPLAEDGYNSKSAQLNINYPLWRRANQLALSQSEMAMSQVAYQLAAAEQDLLVRLAQAWFDVMLARDVLLYSEGQSAATRNQWEQMNYAVKVGLSPSPAAEEARFKYDQALAEQFSAQADQEIKLATLEQIIGPQPSLRPPALSDRYVLADPHAGSLEQWLAEAEAGSPLIQAARQGFEAASEEVRKQGAGHEPTIDLVASYGRNGQGAGSFPGQNGYDIRQGAVGIQVNIPLFSGGTQNGKVAEAVALRERARQDLELARRNVRMNAKQAWFGWQAGEAHRVASTQAVKFTTLALQAAQAGQVSELRSPLDVLQMRQQRLSALRDTQKSRYEMITSHFKLLASVGRLSAADFHALDAGFTNDSADAGLLQAVQSVPALPLR